MHGREMGDMVLGFVFIVFVIICVCQPWNRPVASAVPWVAEECRRLQGGNLDERDRAKLEWLLEVHPQHCSGKER